MLYQVMIIGGLFLSYIIDMASHHLDNSASWRIPVGLQILFGLILVIGIVFLPESPRHLLNCGRTDEARHVIASLNNASLDSELVTDTMAELQDGLAAENEGGKAATWMECFSPRVRIRTIHGIVLQALQQLNGQNFYYYYGDTFFRSAGTGLDSFQTQSVLGGASFVMIFPALYLIERVGRRKSLLTGAVLEATCALIAGLVGHFTLAPEGTLEADLTARELAGGRTLIAFAILHVSFFK